MDLSALLLSRLQFAFTVSFHIVFPSFTIGLAAWLTTIEALPLATARPAYRIAFAFWIIVNNSWMQAPVGYAVENGVFVAVDWSKIIFSPVVWVRFPHMLLASYLTGAFCVAATGAWYLLRGDFHAEARIMLRMGLCLAAVLVPGQLLFGHLTGDYVPDR